MQEQFFNKKKHYSSQNLIETDRVGKSIAAQLMFPACVYLNGDLGVGKTTLCKSIIANLGYTGTVTSPTYNLIQQYPITNGTVYHMDLYRLEDPNELEFLGVNDIWADDSIFLVEWPSKGQPNLVEPTHLIDISNQQGSSPNKQISYIELVRQSV